MSMLICCVITYAIICGIHGQSAMHNLTAELFATYNPAIIPVRDYSRPIQINHYFSFTYLDELNSKEQRLKLNLFEQLEWTDEYLSWEPARHGNITKITASRDQVWLPDISVAEQKGAASHMISSFNIPVVINYRGRVRAPSLRDAELACQLDISDFPFDDQTCLLSVSSWSSKVDQVLISGFLETRLLMPHHEWQLLHSSSMDINVTFIRDDVQQDTDLRTWSYVYYRLKFRRMSAFYSANLILPTVIISFMSALVFFIPPSSGERLSFAITVFVALSLTLIFVIDVVPASSTGQPVISRYTGFSIVMVSLAILFSVGIFNVEGITKPPSKRMRATIRLLARCTCVDPSQIDDSKAQHKESADAASSHDPAEEDDNNRRDRAADSGSDWHVAVSCLDRILGIVYFLVNVGAFLAYFGRFYFW